MAGNLNDSNAIWIFVKIKVVFDIVPISVERNIWVRNASLFYHSSIALFFVVIVIFLSVLFSGEELVFRFCKKKIKISG